VAAIEGQVFHHVARRMKRYGARWSNSGADHLARLLSTDGNGELDQVARSTWQVQADMLK